MDPSNLGQSPFPIMSFNSPNFDYSFLPDQDVDFYGEDGSPISASALNEQPSTSSTSPPTTVPSSNAAAIRKQRMERRGHTKSRRGCYNCKRRRIKCQETRPACGHCLKTGLQCEYPAVPQITHQPQHQIPLFSLQDMRFFQHFLLTCYPHHPLGNENVWTHEVPCLSQNYEYLMHAVLGLAASDLMSEDPSLVTFAMTHRLKAIKAIKKTLTETPKTNTFEEGNALMATCFALTFQSVCLDDGMAEFMTFIRGIVIVAIQMFCKGSKFIFHDFIGEDSMAIVAPLMEKVPCVHGEWVDMAVTAIRALEPLCKTPVDCEYHQLLLEMSEALHVSSLGAYEILCKHYGWWMQIPHDSFQELIDPSNQTQQLLAAHWIALKMIMTPITSVEHQAHKKEPSQKREGDMDVGMLRWLRHLNRQVDEKHHGWNEWPRWVEAQLERDHKFFSLGRPKDQVVTELTAQEEDVP